MSRQFLILGAGAAASHRGTSNPCYHHKGIRSYWWTGALTGRWALIVAMGVAGLAAADDVRVTHRRRCPVWKWLLQPSPGDIAAQVNCTPTTASSAI